MNLTEFLLARIAEDEREANDYWADEYPDQEPEPGSWWHWVLAECEAKRQIVESYQRALNGGPQSLMERVVLQGALQAVATVHADHPDYRAEWRL